MQVTGQTAVTYGYDDAHRMTGITQGTNVVGFPDDVAGRRAQATPPNGVTCHQAWFNLQAARSVKSLAAPTVNGTDRATTLK